MRRKYSLAPCNGLGPSLEFEWDPETGEVTGKDAAKVRAWAEEAKRDGYSMGHPYPTPYKMSDPLRCPGELAVLLGMLWRLPPHLASVYPAPSEGNELPPGAIA